MKKVKKVSAVYRLIRGERTYRAFADQLNHTYPEQVRTSASSLYRYERGLSRPSVALFLKMSRLSKPLVRQQFHNTLRAELMRLMLKSPIAKDDEVFARIASDIFFNPLV